MNLADVFNKFEDEYLKFERVVNKHSNRPDLHAFLLLDSLVPTERETDMVACAEHDEIWLGIDPEELSAVASEEQILELVRCGVRYDADVESLAMFT